MLARAWFTDPAVKDITPQSFMPGREFRVPVESAEDKAMKFRAMFLAISQAQQERAQREEGVTDG